MKKIVIALFVCQMANGLQAQTWNTTGNSLLNANFLGSTNAVPLNFKTNSSVYSLDAMRLLSSTSGNAGALVINPLSVSNTLYQSLGKGLILSDSYLRFYDNTVYPTPPPGGFISGWNTGIDFWGNNGTAPVLNSRIVDQGFLRIMPGIGYDNRMVVEGIVTIGSMYLKYPPGYRLYVQEGILTEKVKVALQTTQDWSDFVFDDDYKLLPINALATYINKNKHLPGVPSAEEMVSQGLDVAKTDAMLLQKIEELTLYLIQLKEQNDKLQTQINELKNK